ncbi:MAG: TetR/AcrR family transcriptional regulator [Actinomycetota bacterium]
MPDAPPTRERLIDAAARNFRRRGYAATGVKAVLRESHAPYGSLYHHFPGGKSDLGVAAIERGSEEYLELTQMYFDDDDTPLDVCIERFFLGAADLLIATDFEDACPIATIAGEIASTDAAMRAAAGRAFESWIAVVEARLAREGITRDTARRCAVQLFCAIEGAFLLARTTRSTEPLLAAGAGVIAALPAT